MAARKSRKANLADCFRKIYIIKIGKNMQNAQVMPIPFHKKEKDRAFWAYAKRGWRAKPECKQMAVHNLFTCLYF